MDVLHARGLLKRAAWEGWEGCLQLHTTVGRAWEVEQVILVVAAVQVMSYGYLQQRGDLIELARTIGAQLALPGQQRAWLPAADACAVCCAGLRRATAAPGLRFQWPLAAANACYL